MILAQGYHRCRSLVCKAELYRQLDALQKIALDQPRVDGAYANPQRGRMAYHDSLPSAARFLWQWCHPVS